MAAEVLHKCLFCSGSGSVSDSEDDRAGVIGERVQPSTKRTLLQPYVQDGSPTVPQSKSSDPNLPEVDSNILYVHDSSDPSVNPDSLYSTLDDAEQQFIPLIDADGSSHGLRSEGKVDLTEALAKDRHVSAEDSNVKNDRNTGSMKNRERADEMEFHGVENVEDGRNNEGVEEQDVIIGGSDKYDVSENVNSHNVAVDVSREKNIDKVKDIKIKSGDSNANALHLPVHERADVNKLSSNKVSTETESSSSGMTVDQHFHHSGTETPSASSDFEQFERDKYRQNEHARQQRHLGTHEMPQFGRIDEELIQQQADVIGDGDAGVVNFPTEHDPHLHHDVRSSADQRHMFSSPDEYFHNNWPKMQQAHGSWPELMHEPQHHMMHMTDDHLFIERDQKAQFDRSWAYVSHEDEHFSHNQRAQGGQFHGQIPNSIFSQQPDQAHPGLHGNVHHRQQYQGYHFQGPDIRQPHVHINQVYRQLPVDQEGFSGRDPDMRPDSYVSSAGIYEGQPGFSTVSQTQRFPTDQMQFDQSSGGERLSSTAPQLETGTPVTQRTIQAGNAQSRGEADVLTSPQEYTSDASPVLGGRYDHIMGELHFR